MKKLVMHRVQREGSMRIRSRGPFGSQPCEGILEVTESPELIAAIRRTELEKGAAIKFIFRTVENRDPMLVAHAESAQILRERPDINRT